MTTEEIRLIPEFTGQTSTTAEQSSLQLRSGYLVYNNSAFGGNLVDEFTVMAFLDNPNNEQLATSFFNYLQSNFAKPEFNELLYNTPKLANVFNDYYDTTVRNNLPPTTIVANLQLTATTAVTYTNTNFIDYNNRSKELITAMIGINTGDSYYVSVSISKTFNIIDNQKNDKYTKFSIGDSISQEAAEEFRYVIRKDTAISNENVSVDFVRKQTKTSPQYFAQSFVDLNFNDSESEFWLNPPTTNFPKEFTISTPPVFVPIPVANSGLTSNFTLVDLTKNILYNDLIKMGYKLSNREGFEGSTITMDGNNPDVRKNVLIGIVFANQKNQRMALFNIRGYNLIKFDVNDSIETNRILGLLKDFFLPYQL